MTCFDDLYDVGYEIFSVCLQILGQVSNFSFGLKIGNVGINCASHDNEKILMKACS